MKLENLYSQSSYPLINEETHISFESLFIELAQANCHPLLERTGQFMTNLQFSEDTQVLDLGCRDGLTTLELAKHHPDVYFVGVEFSDVFLNKANENLNIYNLNNVEFRKSKPEELHYFQAFDTVISNLGLHWIRDKAPVIKSIFNVLKPGGGFYSYSFVDHGRRRFDDCFYQIADTEKWVNTFTNFKSLMPNITPGQLIRIFEKEGLLVNRMQMTRPKYTFPNVTLFKTWLKMQSSHVRFLPKNKIEEFIDEVCMAYLKQNPMNESGEIHLRDYFLSVHTIKPIEE